MWYSLQPGIKVAVSVSDQKMRNISNESLYKAKFKKVSQKIRICAKKDKACQ